MHIISFWLRCQIFHHLFAFLNRKITFGGCVRSDLGVKTRIHFVFYLINIIFILNSFLNNLCFLAFMTGGLINVPNTRPDELIDLIYGLKPY